MNRTAYKELVGGKTRAAEEERLQCAIVDHLHLRAKHDILWWHCPNGGARSKASAGKLKAMGVRPGVPDLQFLFPDGRVAFLEIKVQGGVISDAQSRFGSYCELHDIEWTVIWNIDQALSVLEAWDVIR